MEFLDKEIKLKAKYLIGVVAVLAILLSVIAFLFIPWTYRIPNEMKNTVEEQWMIVESISKESALYSEEEAKDALNVLVEGYVDILHKLKGE